MSAKREEEFFPYFDWARLLLAMTVLWAHTGLFQHIHADYLGDLAVQIFFALSGWLIGGILLRAGKRDLPRFYFNRVTRIWIPYFAAVALLFGVSLLKDPLDAKWAEYLFYEATFTHNIFITPRIESINAEMPLDGAGNHFWSLSVEEQFYLLAPLVIMFLRWGRSAWTWAVFAIIAAAAGLLYASVAAGVSAVALKEQYGDWHRRPLVQGVLALVAAVTLVAIHLKAADYKFLAPIFSVSAVLILARPGKPSQLGAFFGGVSYPLYLNHWIGLILANEALQRFPQVGFGGVVVIATVSGLGFASLCYIAIDRNVRFYRNRLYTPQRGALATALAYGSITIGIVGGLLFMQFR